MKRQQDYLGSQVMNGILIMDCVKVKGRIKYKAICHCGNIFNADPIRIGNRTLDSCGCVIKEGFRPPEFQAWAAQIKELADYLCQACKVEGKRLVSHHILTWANHEDLRYDLGNGICLCQDCHIEYHRQYGRGNNCNQETLAAFLATCAQQLISVDPPVNETEPNYPF